MVKTETHSIVDEGLKNPSDWRYSIGRAPDFTMSRLITAFVFLLTLGAQAAPSDAERVKRGFELSSEKWELEMKVAASPEARQALAAKRPDANVAATELWRVIAMDLKQDWTIPYGAFFLNLTDHLSTADANGSAIPAFRQERARVVKTFSESHFMKPGITPFVVALVDSGDPSTLPLLEKIIAENPDKPTQGIAALGAALTLKSLGEDPQVMKKRLTYLRQAIIESADQLVGGRSVADIASDELYVIRFLTKGRAAPSLSGTDVGDRVVKLSDFQGKVVILVFWDAKSPETDKIINLTNQISEKYAGKPVAILGVTPESITRIRELQADGSIKWNNLYDPSEKLSREYRINSRPTVFVIDGAGKIQYTGLPGSFVELTVDALLNPEKPNE